MIAGILGMLVALLIFLSVILFWNRKPDPTIAIPLNNFLTSEGFTLIEPTGPIFKAIRDAYSLTKSDIFIEQAYESAKDNCIVCWLTGSDGTTNSLVLAISNMNNRGTWVLFCVPNIKGITGSFIRKSFELSLSLSHLKKVELYESIQPDINCDLYVKKGSLIPSFEGEFFSLLPKCGNIIIRSTESVTLIERISIYKTETWEQEARELLRISELLKVCLQ